MWNEESNYTIFLVANDLHGWATSESLPYAEIKISISIDDV